MNVSYGRESGGCRESRLNAAVSSTTGWRVPTVAPEPILVVLRREIPVGDEAKGTP